MVIDKGYFDLLETVIRQAKLLREELDRLRFDWASEKHEIEQILGKALGYPRYADDQKNFPGSTGDDVCVGEQVAITLATEAAERIASLTADLDTEIDPDSVGRTDEQRAARGPHDREELLRSDMGRGREGMERVEF